MSLRRRLALVLCALILFLTVSVSYLLYRRSAGIINQDASDYMSAQLERAKENIDLLLEITQLETKNLAGDLTVRRFLEGGLSQEEASAYLKALKTAQTDAPKHYMDMFILDLTGHITAATDPSFIQLDLSTRDYYQKSLRTGETVTSDILIGRADDSLIVITVSPIYNEEGALLAHAGIAIYAEYLSSIVKTFELGENGYYIILDSQSRILSHPEVSLIATAATIELPEVFDLESESGMGASALPVIQASEDGSERMMFKRMDSNRWILIAVLPEAELRAKSISLLSDVILIGVITSVLAVLAALYISGKITAPIVAITHSINLAAKSSQRLTQSVSSAIRDLGDSDKLFGSDSGRGLAGPDSASSEISNLSGSYQNFKATLSALIKNFSLENEQLLKQTESLTSAIETRNDQTAKFVSLLSHDLRTTLTLVKGYSKALLSRPDADEETREKFLSEIVEGAADLERISSDILDSAYEAQSAPKLHIEEVDGASYTARLFENSKRYILEAGCQFEGLCEIDSGQLAIDPVKISRVWNNLLSNAVKYSQAGGVIRVDMRRVEGVDGSRVELRIEDHGIGIPKEDQLKIFDMFFSGSHNRKKSYGLGLFIAKSFLQAHGSELRFTSEEGCGTTFWFELPLETK
ncbi:sensor histidine kinase [Acidaminobacter hydrogenoformans]|uniref:histidine kinase n=1 Tax=Acidaminobacter hydrogenoformans DSM 2784 TaxID=1120920 RepID=A0A1G5RWW9_9FIRM|nr:sensor histidine kinase [Acidaminobacter hydrogenoformans]SCZ77951.1 His Kinase A (phospho-acceptor) domain-containing protein [Acidaminobacter hydrogenoformans DSM 2784]